MIILVYAVIAVISYLLGSLNFGVIISNKFSNDDVRNYGSGNAGTTNMLRNYGKKYAAFTIIGDMLKVAVAIFAAFALLKYTPFEIYDNSVYNAILEKADYKMLVKSFAGFFCVLGHIFPCFFKFKGGKGVATSGGMVFLVDWRIALILLAVFIIVVAVSKYVSLGSIIMALLYPILIYAFHRSLILALIAFVFTAVVVMAHRENIVKLVNHTESKISDKRKSRDDKNE